MLEIQNHYGDFYSTKNFVLMLQIQGIELMLEHRRHFVAVTAPRTLLHC